MSTRGWEHATVRDIRDRRVTVPQKRRPKYGATPTTLDGIRFDSAKEAKRYLELKALERAGEIWELELQPAFELFAPSTSGYLLRAAIAVASSGLFSLGYYYGDFKYCDKATVPYVVEDVKGVRTALYKWKKKHVEAQYGIRIREV